MADINKNININVNAEGAIDELNQIKGAVKDTGDALEKSKSKTGGFGKALDSLGGPIGQTISGMKMMLKQMWAMVANPIGAIIAGVVLVFTGLYKILSQFDPVMDAIEQGMAAVGAVINVVVQSVTALFTGATKLKDVFKGLGGRMKEAAVEAANLKNAMQELEDAQIRVAVSNSKLQTQIEELLLQSKDRTKTEEERIALIEDALKLEAEQFDATKALADERLRIAEDELAIKAGLNEEERKLLKERGIDYALELQNEKSGVEDLIKKYQEALLNEEEIQRQSVALREKSLNRKYTLEDAAIEREKKLREDAEAARIKAEEEEAKRRESAVQIQSMKRIEVKKEEVKLINTINHDTATKEIEEAKRVDEVKRQLAEDDRNRRLYLANESLNLAAVGNQQMEMLNEVVFMNQLNRQKELLANGTITQEQFDKNKAALEKKAAKRAKTLAISAAVINTAQAIIAQLGNPTPWVGFALAAAAAATGALSIAKIKATDYGEGGGGGGSTAGGTGSAPTAGTAPSTSFSFTPQTTTTQPAPTKSYVVSKDVENQQQLDRQIMANGTT
jgi:hypothetical protein